MFFISSSKLPVVILLAKDFLEIGDGLDFKATCRTSVTILFLLFLSAPASLGTISSNKTSTPIFAKWQAILLPITPEPRTATLHQQKTSRTLVCS